MSPEPRVTREEAFLLLQSTEDRDEGHTRVAAVLRSYLSALSELEAQRGLIERLGDELTETMDATFNGAPPGCSFESYHGKKSVDTYLAYRAWKQKKEA